MYKIRPGSEDWFMLIHPSGKVEFLGFWDGIKIIWKLIRERKKFCIDDGEDVLIINEDDKNKNS